MAACPGIGAGAVPVAAEPVAGAAGAALLGDDAAAAATPCDADDDAVVVAAASAGAGAVGSTGTTGTTGACDAALAAASEAALAAVVSEELALDASAASLFRPARPDGDEPAAAPAAVTVAASDVWGGALRIGLLRTRTLRSGSRGTGTLGTCALGGGTLGGGSLGTGTGTQNSGTGNSGCPTPLDCRRPVSSAPAPRQAAGWPRYWPALAPRHWHRRDAARRTRRSPTPQPPRAQARDRVRREEEIRCSCRGTPYVVSPSVASAGPVCRHSPKALQHLTHFRRHELGCRLIAAPSANSTGGYRENLPSAIGYPFDLPRAVWERSDAAHPMRSPTP